jgi:hypothetical protein
MRPQGLHNMSPSATPGALLLGLRGACARQGSAPIAIGLISAVPGHRSPNLPHATLTCACRRVSRAPRSSTIDCRRRCVLVSPGFDGSMGGMEMRDSTELKKKKERKTNRPTRFRKYYRGRSSSTNISSRKIISYYLWFL